MFMSFELRWKDGQRMDVNNVDFVCADEQNGLLGACIIVYTTLRPREISSCWDKAPYGPSRSEWFISSALQMAW